MDVVCTAECKSNHVGSCVRRKWVHLVIGSELDLEVLADAEEECFGSVDIFDVRYRSFATREILAYPWEPSLAVSFLKASPGFKR